MATIKLADGRGELYQWDTGRKVVIDDESIKQVHYQNRFYGRTQPRWNINAYIHRRRMGVK